MLLPLTASVIDSSTIIVSSSTAPSTPHSHRSAIVDTIDSPLATLSDVIHPSSSLAPPSPIAYSLDRVLSNLQSFERSIQNGTVRDSLSRYGNVAAIDAMIKLAQFQSERQSSGVVLVLALLQTHSVLLSFWNTANGVDASDQSVGAPSWAQLTTTLTTDQTQVLVKYQGTIMRTIDEFMLDLQASLRGSNDIVLLSFLPSSISMHFSPRESRRWTDV